MYCILSHNSMKSMRDQVCVLHLPIRLSLPAVSGHGVRGPARHREPGGHALVVKRQLAVETGEQVRCHIYIYSQIYLLKLMYCATSVLYCKYILSCATIHPHYFKLQTFRYFPDSIISAQGGHSESFLPVPAKQCPIWRQFSFLQEIRGVFNASGSP